MKYIVIGLGYYGRILAEQLSENGHDVIGADIDTTRVDAIKDSISTAYILDSTDELALGILPVRTVDAVIVAMGTNFASSIRTVALLKKMGAAHIYARALDEVHKSVLEAMSVDRILTPEEDSARLHAREMAAKE